MATKLLANPRSDAKAGGKKVLFFPFDANQVATVHITQSPQRRMA